MTKYILMLCLVLGMGSCKNAVDPVETFSKEWISGNWQMETSPFPSFPQDKVLQFNFNNDSITLQNALLMTIDGSGLGVVLIFTYSGIVENIDTDKKTIETIFPKYPYYGDSDGVSHTPLSATISFNNNNQFTFKASGNFTDSLSGQKFTDWQVTFNRKNY